ncbi:MULTISPECIES: UDP-4-amino-4,6-dideoxy-N-acetyl-beta-L-altrosamine N-acetyltransferase [Pseudomonas]|uniref:UDP-4-amino-4, 6-dideoxy-N-acetyl-beta-L-altrosamine N-acetyltransferase n=1 Tax=Pseudomonas taiwanensis TaxID=470150 RepID=A0ABR6V7P3_9PSED|nr:MULTISPECIES: UDP-4-amino-4,6-dideoxy-N-acetyl-beta-L-altrosamine N-acetyltransferase [Pseudomonas]AVD86525.1 UDP-4-amino-4,6-dideoxy-N-acetyl-beta-L-altrosamine N-acetyltransferase [Pseudomonas sp. SWI44]MBC3476315.1 UDP-4-amino-4,6-dideoxy-N-acetyl-beta-L-altrosamine N-acetyltransferase [Pseudomonas taiwanensis]MBC3493995.1 UDP-4-amino-4,6-dideoxy-N-acetyl-beta-L-altrosamine N-acetyltransferase [Pseudomonas taiwanensis]
MRSIIRPMRFEDLDIVLTWRNHPEVRRYMYTQHEISMEEHARWFENSQKNQSRHLMIFELDEKPAGFVNLTEATKGHLADWGFYLAPDAPRGTGRLLGETALRYAFCQLGLHKVCGQALSFNERSIRFHLALGFQEEGALRDQHFDGAQYHDVIHFGLLQPEWQAKQRETES